MNTILLNFVTQAAFLAVMPADFVQNGETGAPLPAGVDAISIIGALWTNDTVPVQVPGFFVIATAAPGSLASYVTSWPLNVTQRVFG